MLNKKNFLIAQLLSMLVMWASCNMDLEPLNGGQVKMLSKNNLQMEDENIQQAQSKATSSQTEDFLLLAKICQTAKLYDDMLNYINSYIKYSDNKNFFLSNEGKDLLSVAYDNVISSHLQKVRVLTYSIGSTPDITTNEEHIKYLQTYFKEKILSELELDKSLNDILQYLDNTLIPEAEGDNELSAFYLIMRGDYHRSIAELSTDADKLRREQNSAIEFYNEATEQAVKLKTTNPIRLRLALNFSVFYYEIMNDLEKAASLANQAFSEAIADIEELDDDAYQDATTIMMKIRDNLSLWTLELNEH